MDYSLGLIFTMRRRVIPNIVRRAVHHETNCAQKFDSVSLTYREDVELACQPCVSHPVPHNGLQIGKVRNWPPGRPTATTSFTTHEPLSEASNQAVPTPATSQPSYGVMVVSSIWATCIIAA
jgi:hypothetical protein